MAHGFYCRIQVKGLLSEPWSGWFGGLRIEAQPKGETLLSGCLPDQPALYGVLERMRDSGVELVSMKCVQVGREAGQDDAELE